MSGDIPRLVVLGSIRQQAEQASKQYSSASAPPSVMNSDVEVYTK